MQSGLTMSLKVTASARVSTAESEPVDTDPVQLGLILIVETGTTCVGSVLSWVATYTRRSEAVTVSSTQWAAVSTCLLLMRAPPHKNLPPMSRYTTQGYSFGSVSLPPNILVGLLGIPQLHVELAGVVVVVVKIADDDDDGSGVELG